VKRITTATSTSDLAVLRHDQDNKIPRTPDEIYDLNRAVAKKMEKIFLNKGIPVIPSIGAHYL
jgi:hypothetical protein